MSRPEFRNSGDESRIFSSGAACGASPVMRTASRVRSMVLVQAGGAIRLRQLVERVQVAGASRRGIRSSISAAGAQCVGLAVERGGALRPWARSRAISACRLARYCRSRVTSNRAPCRPPPAAASPASTSVGTNSRARAGAAMLRRQHVRRRRQPGTSPGQRRGVRQCVAGKIVLHRVDGRPGQHLFQRAAAPFRAAAAIRKAPGWRRAPAPGRIRRKKPAAQALSPYTSTAPAAVRLSARNPSRRPAVQPDGRVHRRGRKSEAGNRDPAALNSST